jgi:predicted RNA-binding Zn ribbon-like protein
VAAVVEAGALTGLPLHLSRTDGPDLLVAEPTSLARHVAGRAVAALLRSTAHPVWDRVQACAGPDCAWVYVDASRNRSRRWCQMSRCGDRATGAAFRQRARTPRTRSR